MFDTANLISANNSLFSFSSLLLTSGTSRENKFLAWLRKIIRLTLGREEHKVVQNCYQPFRPLDMADANWGDLIRASSPSTQFISWNKSSGRNQCTGSRSTVRWQSQDQIMLERKVGLLDLISCVIKNSSVFWISSGVASQKNSPKLGHVLYESSTGLEESSSGGLSSLPLLTDSRYVWRLTLQNHREYVQTTIWQGWMVRWSTRCCCALHSNCNLVFAFFEQTNIAVVDFREYTSGLQQIDFVRDSLLNHFSSCFTVPQNIWPIKQPDSPPVDE